MQLYTIKFLYLFKFSIIFILLYLYFEDIYIFIPFLLNFCIFLIIFFKLNFFEIKNKSLHLDNIYRISSNYILHNSFLLNINKIFLFFILFYLYLFKGVNNSIWWQHFKISNLNLNLILILVLFNLFFIIICKNISLIQKFVKLDYFFIIILLTLFLPLVFLVNTLFTFLFLLEFVSIMIFYKFIISKIWKINDIKNINNFLIFRNLPNYYLNMLFFQYWATFFSTVLIIFSLINYIYLYGTTEWFILNLLVGFNLNINLYNLNILILSFILLFSFFIKIGLTPLHLYKVEVYKGLPFFAIFFYTTFYFLAYFLFFIIFIILYLDSFSIYSLYVICILMFSGFIFIISLLFSINYVKAFFAYSSVINSIGFLLIIICLLNF